MTAPVSVAVLLDQLDAARAKATPGVWLHRFHVGASGDVSIVVAEGYGFPAECADQNGDADAACIVAEHNSMPRLVAAVRAVLELLDPENGMATGDGYSGQRLFYETDIRAAVASALAEEGA